MQGQGIHIEAREICQWAEAGLDMCMIGLANCYKRAQTYLQERILGVKAYLGKAVRGLQRKDEETSAIETKRQNVWCRWQCLVLPVERADVRLRAAILFRSPRRAMPVEEKPLSKDAG